jgi:hypothetical protein
VSHRPEAGEEGEEPLKAEGVVSFPKILDSWYVSHCVSLACCSIYQVSRLESFWALHVVCGEQLTALLAWIREPWEELFSIGLRTVTQEALDLDR